MQEIDVGNKKKSIYEKQRGKIEIQEPRERKLGGLRRKKKEALIAERKEWEIRLIERCENSSRNFISKCKVFALCNTKKSYIMIQAGDEKWKQPCKEWNC